MKGFLQQPSLCLYCLSLTRSKRQRQNGSTTTKARPASEFLLSSLLTPHSWDPRVSTPFQGFPGQHCRGTQSTPQRGWRNSTSCSQRPQEKLGCVRSPGRADPASSAQLKPRWKTIPARAFLSHGRGGEVPPTSLCRGSGYRDTKGAPLLRGGHDPREGVPAFHGGAHKASHGEGHDPKGIHISQLKVGVHTGEWGASISHRGERFTTQKWWGLQWGA